MKKYDGKVIDITATVEKLGDKCLDLMPADALSGCDSAINLISNSRLKLRYFSDPLAPEEEWVTEGIQFLSSLYGGMGSTSLFLLGRKHHIR